MFVHQDAATADAMQEIEVVSMADGEDNVTTTSIITSPPTRAASTWPPSHPHAPGFSPELDSLLAMLDGETTLPVVDHEARSSIAATPISMSRGDCASPARRSRNAVREREDASDPVTDDDRTKMCDWYYEMSDFLKIDKATASRSLSLLDRFMAAPVHRMVGTTPSGSSSMMPSSSATQRQSEHQDCGYSVAGVVVAASFMRDEYQLAALTALFLSIKLFERLNIQLEHVSYLSRGRYTPGEVMRMELIMLQALDWRVCRADKVDYVNAYLNVMLPENHQVDDPYHHMLLLSLKDVANLQIKMSDYDSSFSKQKPSLVAFASVINAFELRKDDMSIIDRHRFLESAHALMAGLDHIERREELPRTAERLRALVNPPPVANYRSTEVFICSSQSLSPSPFDTILQQREISIRHEGDVRGVNYDGIFVNSNETDSRQYAKMSPFDVALESMENLDVARLLCCGSIDHTFYHRNGSNDESHRGNHERMKPGKKQRRCHVPTTRSGDGMAKSHSSPTSISNIIFGAASKTV
ncbi:hypothetical protein ACHAXA_009046 [Cyclostephanos tholiformis]|uniref:Cyclin N-terminal domain-containing protein n=1 Tax=Cyclostephanos tholiformis TaxID=382380 RepID=A0ABD3R651_9STRA